jgi:starvation-inducible outer membrane lipoprotein
VSWNIDFRDIRRQPEAYVGRLVALGGIVARIDAVDEGYRVLVRELPLDGSHRPNFDQPPRGLFIVVIPRHRLPPDLGPGVEVTVVGEILGRGKAPGAEGDEEVPLLDERYTHVWGSSWWPQIQIGIWGGIAI